MAADRPIIRRIFAMLDPITLPMAIPGAYVFPTTDNKLVSSSGTEVPNPTTTIPIKSGESLRLLAIPRDPLTKYSPPPRRKISPKVRRIIEYDISWSIFIVYNSSYLFTQFSTTKRELSQNSFFVILYPKRAASSLGEAWPAERRKSMYLGTKAAPSFR